jgi:hypothetical protein
VISFSGHATDPGSDDLTFTWDWGDGTSDTVTTYFNDGVGPDPYPSPEINSIDVTDVVTHTYGDNGIFSVTLTVTDDDGGTSIESTTVTVYNVVPTATIDDMILPYPDNPDFILPIVHTLPFIATGTDPGSDDLTFTWDWDDGTFNITTYLNDIAFDPDPYPSPQINPRNVIDNAYHVYSTPGTYNVTLTVTDDDGGTITTAAWEVKVLNAEEAKHDINNYIQDLSNYLFRGNPINRKNAFNNMFDALDDMLDDEEYWGMIKHLKNNIREKCDGWVDGKKGDDWIKGFLPEGYDAQWHICNKIDDYCLYLATFL